MKRLLTTVTIVCFLWACNGAGSSNTTTIDSTTGTNGAGDSMRDTGNRMLPDSMNKAGVKPDSTMRQ
jgi:hypothetical protein